MRDLNREEFLKNIAIHSSEKNDIDLDVLVCPECDHALILPTNFDYTGCECTRFTTPIKYHIVFSTADLPKNTPEGCMTNIWN